MIMLEINIDISAKLGKWSDKYYGAYSIALPEDYLDDMTDDEKYDVVLEVLFRGLDGVLSERGLI